MPMVVNFKLYRNKQFNLRKYISLVIQASTRSSDYLNSPSKLEGVPEGGGRVSIKLHFYTLLRP